MAEEVIEEISDLICDMVLYKDIGDYFHFSKLVTSSEHRNFLISYQSNQAVMKKVLRRVTKRFENVKIFIRALQRADYLWLNNFIYQEILNRRKKLKVIDPKSMPSNSRLWSMSKLAKSLEEMLNIKSLRKSQAEEEDELFALNESIKVFHSSFRDDRDLETFFEPKSHPGLVTKYRDKFQRWSMFERKGTLSYFKSQTISKTFFDKNMEVEDSKSAILYNVPEIDSTDEDHDKVIIQKLGQIIGIKNEKLEVKTNRISFPKRKKRQSFLQSRVKKTKSLRPIRIDFRSANECTEFMALLQKFVTTSSSNNLKMQDKNFKSLDWEKFEAKFIGRVAEDLPSLENDVSKEFSFQRSFSVRTVA